MPAVLLAPVERVRVAGIAFGGARAVSHQAHVTCCGGGEWSELGGGAAVGKETAAGKERALDLEQRQPAAAQVFAAAKTEYRAVVGGALHTVAAAGMMQRFDRQVQAAIQLHIFLCRGG